MWARPRSDRSGSQAEDEIQGENYSLALTEATLTKKVKETYTALESQAEKHGQRIPH